MAPPLSSDIIYCVLTSLPDFETLLSGILISKAFYRVYQGHPSSTLTSVATTQIGPEILPCAIRLAHFKRDEYLASRGAYVRGFPSERKFTHTEAPAVTPYAGALAKNDSVVRELELFYSAVYVLSSIRPRRCIKGCFGNRCKDRASGSRSLLNPRESLRFRRAFYRWWLFINLIPPSYLRSTQATRESEENETEEGGSVANTDDGIDDDTDEYTDDDTEDDTDNDSDNGDGAGINAPVVFLAESNDLRKGFLSEFSHDEVVEMWQVHSFMVFVSSWIRNSTSEPTMHDCGLLTYIHLMFHSMGIEPLLDLLLWHGPFTTAGVLRTLRTFDKPEAHFTEVLSWDYGYPDPIWPGFSEYLRGKNYDTSKVETNIWDPIIGSGALLDSRVEDSEECRSTRYSALLNVLNGCRRRMS